MQSLTTDFNRICPLPERPETSIALWGMRRVGKSHLLLRRYPQAYWIDLLKSDQFLRYSTAPWSLREEILAHDIPLVVIDEVQRIPALLDEVHWLIENRGTVFVLSGSSARKLRRRGANLLAGRAVRRELHGLVYAEIEAHFDLLRLLNFGYLPPHYLALNADDLLRAYISDYLQVEIAAEGVVRNIPIFSRFLEAAALSDTEQISFSNIARECGVSPPTVQNYFEILVDTLLGDFLRSYRHRPKRRQVLAPKFYFRDLGVVNFLARRTGLRDGSELFGKALENYVHHELQAYRAYRAPDLCLSFWRLSGGREVDFILNDLQVCVEVKATNRVIDPHLSGLRELRKDHRAAKQLQLVCLEKIPRRTSDRIDILPLELWLQMLWAGELIK